MRLIVWVLFVNSIVCLFVFYACFLFLSVFGWDCWLGFVFGWFFWALTFCFCSESLILAQDERWRRA